MLLFLSLLCCFFAAVVVVSVVVMMVFLTDALQIFESALSFQFFLKNKFYLQSVVIGGCHFFSLDYILFLGAPVLR